MEFPGWTVLYADVINNPVTHSTARGIFSLGAWEANQQLVEASRHGEQLNSFRRSRNDRVKGKPMRSTILSATVFVLSLCLVVGVSAATIPIEHFRKIVPQRGKNMLMNGDFEKDTNGDGMPDEWGRVEHWLKTTRTEVGRATMPDGNHVLKVHFLTDGGCVINYLLSQESRYFEPGQATDVYHALRVKHVGHGVVYGHAINSHYKPIGSTRKIGTQGDWRTAGAVYRYDPAVLRSIALVRIYIRGARAGDTYWIDDYVLKTVTADEAKALSRGTETQKNWKVVSSREAAAIKDVRKSNLLHDSSFESNPDYCPVRFGAKWWAVGGEIVKGDAAHGDYAIRDEATSDPVLFRDRKPHTLSFFAKKADGDRVTAAVSDSFSGNLAARQTFTLTSDWKRFSFAFVPVQHEEAAQAALKVAIKGVGCLIDAVQLEEGGLTDYASLDGELSLLVGRRPDRSCISFFYDGEKVPVLVAAQKAGPAEVKADIVVRDFWMNVVARTPVRFSIPAEKAVAREEEALGPFARGAYLVGLEGGGKKSRSIQFGVISRALAKGSEIMGGSHETGREFNRHFIDALGVTWTRHHAAYTGPYWGRKADVPWLGENYWQSCDKYTREKAWNPKLRHWGSFVYPPEPWRSEVKKVSGTKEPLPEGFFKNSTEYFEATMPRYKKTIKYWECWNEPVQFTPEQYLQMLKWFNKTIKRLEPQATTIGFSGFLDPGYWTSYMAPLMEMGALGHCDVISYHGYFNGWPEGDTSWNGKSLVYYLDHIRNQAAQAGKGDMPIWDDEFTFQGRSWYEGERLGDKRSARAEPFDYAAGASVIVHYVTIAYANGVRHFGAHCFDHNLSIQNRGHRDYSKHAMEYDYAIKPKTISYAVACNKMNGAKLARKKTEGDLFVYVFDKPSGSLAVVFMGKGRKATLSMGTVDGLAFRNLFDGPFAGVSKADGRIWLELVGQPVYIESKDDGKTLADALSGLSVPVPK